MRTTTLLEQDHAVRRVDAARTLLSLMSVYGADYAECACILEKSSSRILHAVRVTNFGEWVRR